MSLAVDTLQQLFDAVPFHASFPLTIELLDVEEGTIECSVEPTIALSRDPTRVEFHGGAIASLLDLSGTFLILGMTGSAVATIGLSIDFLAPAREGTFTSRARILRAGRTVTVVDASLTDANGVVVAVARGSYATPKEAST
jgi:uncharacterized protein (TIGR00369 family)